MSLAEPRPIRELIKAPGQSILPRRGGDEFPLIDLTLEEHRRTLGEY